MDDLKAGDRISITIKDSDAEVLEATICRLVEDRGEGLAPEIEDYVAGWIEISFSDCNEPATRRTLTFGTDFQYDLDGRKVNVRKLLADS